MGRCFFSLPAATTTTRNVSTRNAIEDDRGSLSPSFVFLDDRVVTGPLPFAVRFGGWGVGVFLRLGTRLSRPAWVSIHLQSSRDTSALGMLLSIDTHTHTHTHTRTAPVTSHTHTHTHTHTHSRPGQP